MSTRQVVKVTEKETGSVHVGVVASSGPTTFRMMVVWPFQEQGRFVEMPRGQIERTETVELPAIGGEPQATRTTEDRQQIP